MAYEEKKPLTEEELEQISGGGVLDRLPKVTENDYDDEVIDKVGGD